MSVEKIGVKARLREVFSKPSVKAFVLIYLSALGIQLYDSVKNAAFLLFVSLLFFALLYGAVRLTSGIKVEVVPVRMPLIGVITCALIQASGFLVSWGFNTGLISEISQDLELTRFSINFLIFAVIPLMVLKLKGESRQSYGLTLKNWKRCLGVSLVLGGLKGILFFYNNPANSPILVGEVEPLTVVAALPVSFLYLFFAAGFPEELFYRAFLQEHLSSLLKSPTDALVVASLIFGWVHIPSIIIWYPGTSVHVAFAYTTLVQAVAGLFYGVLWQRTRSLIPPAVTHTLADASSNLMTIIQSMGL